MLAAHRDGMGQRRRDLHVAVEKIFVDEPTCDWRRVESFRELLDDESESGVLVRNGLLARRQSGSTSCLAESAAMTAPEKGTVHWPTMYKPDRQLLPLVRPMLPARLAGRRP
jgi:hypothetical protein